MDTKLAEMYGTNTIDDDDLEKLAAAELADQLADDGQMDLDNIDPDALEALAEEVLSGDDGDDDQVKLAEADYLGRVMAHSYVQELRGIEKAAAEEGPGMFARGAQHVEDFGRKGTDAVGRGAAYVGKKAFEHRGKIGLGLAAAGAAAGGKKIYDKVKKSSALETLVDARAQEILAENGIDLEKIAAEEERHRIYKGNKRALHSREVGGREAGRQAGSIAGTALGGLATARRTAQFLGSAKGTGLRGHAAKAGYTALGGLGGALFGSHAGKHVGGSLGKSVGTLRGHEKKSSAYNDYDVLADVVEQQAWELLAANGFVSDEE